MAQGQSAVAGPHDGLVASSGFDHIVRIERPFCARQTRAPLKINALFFSPIRARDEAALLGIIAEALRESDRWIVDADYCGHHRDPTQVEIATYYRDEPVTTCSLLYREGYENDPECRVHDTNAEPSALALLIDELLADDRRKRTQALLEAFKALGIEHDSPLESAHLNYILGALSVRSEMAAMSDLPIMEAMSKISEVPVQYYEKASELSHPGATSSLGYYTTKTYGGTSGVMLNIIQRAQRNITPVLTPELKGQLVEVGANFEQGVAQGVGKYVTYATYLEGLGYTVSGGDLVRSATATPPPLRIENLVNARYCGTYQKTSRLSAALGALMASISRCDGQWSYGLNGLTQHRFAVRRDVACSAVRDDRTTCTFPAKLVWHVNMQGLEAHMRLMAGMGAADMIFPSSATFENTANGWRMIGPMNLGDAILPSLD